MKLAILIFLISLSAWAKVSLELVTSSPVVKQGEIATGKLIVRESTGQTSFSGLKGKNFAKTLYLMKLSPFMGKQGALESEAKFIFLAVPQSKVLSEQMDGQEVQIFWNQIEVTPTETSKSFLFGDFDVPERKKILPWILGLLGLGLLIGLGFIIKDRLGKRHKQKEKLQMLKAEILSCKTYDDIVQMWRQKHKFLDTFPQLEKSFKKLEETLFKYQFKQRRSEVEMEAVLDAYNEFKQESSGALNGI